MKTAFITGASRGIGRAIARRFAVDGYRVVVHYASNRAAAEASLAGIDGEHLLLQGDLSDENEIPAVAEQALDYAGGALDVFVHNAGIYEATPIAGEDRLLLHEWRGRWRRQMQVNLLAGVDLTYLLLPALQQSGSGRVVHISSRAGIRGEALHSAYAASKAAQANFVKSLAMELAPYGVYTFGIAPGWTATDMAAEALAARGDEIRAAIPFGRVADPDEIAALAAFLCTEQGAYLTGNIIDANGASYLH